MHTLKGHGPFTVFAPTDEAFAALPEGTVEGLLADPAALREILLYHVIATDITSDELTQDVRASTIQGEFVTIDVDPGVKVNDATVTTADVLASNGVIHVIDKVLLPN